MGWGWGVESEPRNRAEETFEPPGQAGLEASSLFNIFQCLSQLMSFFSLLSLFELNFLSLTVKRELPLIVVIGSGPQFPDVGSELQDDVNSPNHPALNSGQYLSKTRQCYH